MIERIKDWYKGYLNPPPGFDPRNLRFFIVTSLAGPFGAIIAALLIPLFWSMGIPVMAYVMIVSLLVWITVIWMGHSGRIFAAAYIVFVMVLIQSFLSVHYIGWGFGYQYYLFTVVTACFLLPGRLWPGLLVAAAATIEFALLSRLSGQNAWNGSPEFLYPFNVFNIVIAFGLSGLLAVYYRNIAERAEEALEAEYAKSEALLNNILPTEIARRLKHSQATIADRFENASILFADIVDFTPISKQLSPNQVVELLDNLFSRFDALVGEYQLEKIKTVGDAYMVAAGIPSPRSDHAEALADLAFAMLDSLETYNAEMGMNLRLRIGINSGPVVAGVIGKLRFLYDLWGDCVNTASRMESHGAPNKIQVTQDTYNLLSGKYRCESRGLIEVKGRGQMQTYFLEK